MVRSFGILGLGLIALAALQAFYGLWPLRRVRAAIASIRSGEKSRIEERFPHEIEPLTGELNALLAHNEMQAEEARRHAGNLAHALKTPLTVITNAASANGDDLADTVMPRSDDDAAPDRPSSRPRPRDRPPLERAGARPTSGRRSKRSSARSSGSTGRSRSTWPATRDAAVRVERQDLDEMLGNLIENAAKYGGGRVFVTVEDGRPTASRSRSRMTAPAFPRPMRASMFDRGARLDLSKPGTGLGLAIVRDVAEIYGGSIRLEESEDLGGLLARLRLPLAP